MTSVNSPARRARTLAAAALATVALGGCTDWAGYDIDRAAGTVPHLSTMRRSVIPDPYEAVREAPEHAIPSAGGQGDVPYRFSQEQLDSVAATLTNPLRPTAEVLRRGQLKYQQNCSVCHGEKGAGDGPVVGNGKFPYAPSLVSGSALTRSDGYLYAVIVAGRNFMPPYGERMSHTDRWATVVYMRQLQGPRANPGAAAPLPTTTPGQAAATSQGAAASPLGQGTPSAPVVPGQPADTNRAPTPR